MAENGKTLISAQSRLLDDPESPKTKYAPRELVEVNTVYHNWGFSYSRSLRHSNFDSGVSSWRNLANKYRKLSSGFKMAP